MREFEAASKKEGLKKIKERKKKGEVISDMFAGLLSVFDVSS